MKVGILCEMSGVVRDAFIARGHDAVSCDLLPTERPGPHLQGDCLSFDWSGFNLIVAHPPCTYLCNSGVRWLDTQPGRRERMREAAEFFLALWNLPVECVAIENPVMHGHAKRIIGIEPSQSIQPWQFGHGECKRTCLWLRGIQTLRPTNIVAGRVQRVHLMPPGVDRWKERSRTLTGVAEAMAEQWGTPPADQVNWNTRPVAAGGKGCAVFCTLNVYDHAKYPEACGIPEVLARLEDAIFEGLHGIGAKEDGQAWPEQFLSAPKVGADLSMVHPRFTLALMSDPESPVVKGAAGFEAARLAVVGVADLFRVWVETGNRPEEAAWSAAWSAAEAAARSAEAAARSEGATA